VRLADTEQSAGHSAPELGELAEGWALCTVRDLVEINYGKGLIASNRAGGTVPVYGSNGVVGSHNVALTKGPAIVLGRKGTVGAVHYSPVACWPIDTTYFVDQFDAVDASYLTHVLRSLDLSELDTSTAVPGLNREDIYRQSVSLPPLREQKRIVRKVDDVLERVDAARQRLARAAAIVKRFRQAVLAAACSGRLTADWREEHPDVEPATVSFKGRNGSGGETPRWRRSEQPPADVDVSPLPDVPESWSWASVDEISSVVVDCPHSTPKWSPSGEICLRTTNFRPGFLDLSEVRHVSAETYVQRTGRLEPRPADVVYSREGGILGIAAMIPPGVKACLGQRMMLMRTDDRRYVATLLMHVLNSPSILKRVAELTGGTASPHLNVADIRAFQVPLPPLEEQHEVVRRVEALFKLADAIERRGAAATARADRLTQSILAKAFRGELVPTEAELARREGRDYELASVLLARIKRDAG